MSTEQKLVSGTQSSVNKNVELMGAGSNGESESLSLNSTAVLSSLIHQNGDDTEERCFIRSTN